jgi:hypothetical protein
MAPSRLEQAAGRLSWRRVTITAGLQTFAGAALWWAKLDPDTWAWFAFGLASMYIGGDTLEKVTTLVSAVRSKKEPADG